MGGNTVSKHASEDLSPVATGQGLEGQSGLSCRSARGHPSAVPGLLRCLQETVSRNHRRPRTLEACSVFGDDQIAAAVTGCVAHHGRLLQFRGESYRVWHALMQGQPPRLFLRVINGSQSKTVPGIQRQKHPPTPQSPQCPRRSPCQCPRSQFPYRSWDSHSWLKSHSCNPTRARQPPLVQIGSGSSVPRRQTCPPRQTTHRREPRSCDTFPQAGLRAPSPRAG